MSFFERSSRRKTRHQLTLSLTDKPKKTVSRSSSHAGSTYTPPPVMMRGSMAGPFVEGKRRRVKNSRLPRKIEVPLRTPGAHVSLPTMPQVSVGWRLVSFVLVALLSVTLYAFWNFPQFQVDAPVYSGIVRLNENALTAAMELDDQPVFIMNAGSLEEKLLKSIPEISSVGIRIDFPNSFKVNVTERIPVLAWNQNGQIILVDREGWGFPARGDISDLPIPMVKATIAPAGVGASTLVTKTVQTSSKDLLEILELDDDMGLNGIIGASEQQTNTVKTFMDPLLVETILSLSKDLPENTPLMYDWLRGLGWVDAHGWEAYFGDPEDIPMKLKVYHALVEKLLAANIQPAVISVEEVHFPYYRLEK